ncbi:Ionotropic receptor 236a [Blattella germanica]|nr:Ionotropic receptor 236a [Blattella germanica]PSN56160.1 Ionotropic receptor 236a [Blattella germanica]
MFIMIKALISIITFIIFLTHAERILEDDEEDQEATLIARCIKAIGQQNFINGLPLITTFQLRSDLQTINNLENILLEEFHDNLIWPMFISQPAQSNVEKEWTTDKYEKIHNYILVLDYQYQEYNKTINDLRLQIQQLKSYRAWYSRGKYVVTMEVSVPREEVQTLVKMVLNEAWLSYIYNIVVLIPIADFNSTKEIEIYTWFPYQMPSGSCGVLQEPVLLDKCMSTEGNVKFLKNEPLFPNKVPNDLKGCPLTVMTYMFEPYIKTEDGIWNNTIIGGSELSLMECLKEHMNISLELRIVSNFSYQWLATRAELSVNRSIDAMFAALLINDEDFERFDGSSVYHSERFTWTVPRAEMYPKWQGITRVFTLANWALQFLTIVFVSVFITILFRIRYSKSGELWNLSKSLLSMWAVYLGDGSPNEPKEMIVRLFFLSWVFQAFALNTVFQAFFTSYQIDPGRQHQIADFDEFQATKPTYLYPDPLEIFFPSDIVKIVKKHRYICYPDDCMAYVATHKRCGLLWGREYFKYSIDQMVKRVHGHDLYTFNYNLGEESFVFYTQKGFPFFPRMNSVLGRIFQGGFYDYWIDMLIVEKRIQAGIVKLEVMDEFVELSLAHLQGACMFFGLGILTSSLLFLCELGFHAAHKFRIKNN